MGLELCQTQCHHLQVWIRRKRLGGGYFAQRYKYKFNGNTKDNDRPSPRSPTFHGLQASGSTAATANKNVLTEPFPSARMLLLWPFSNCRTRTTNS
ncbi:hypothetical protein XELAEV_18043350mg [Xenopus laevis]|uniref:Uncharacterized protein n=1 Tax=Xenopus laevis TaxID=8355 RepID=A0A974H2R6_XENLA|nr:hypothetical protein XELAEV_18043350mg [Xenopus laevis]